MYFMLKSGQELLLHEGKPPSIPNALNILTILTFIGCGVRLVTMPLFKWGISFVLKAVENNTEVLDKMSAKELEEFKNKKNVIEAINSNYLILFAVATLGAVLCIYGAIRMRKLKKEGFYFYVVGQILPIIISTILLGYTIQFAGSKSYLFSLGISFLFIFLYSRHLSKMS